MNDKSAAELERDADIARAKLTDTADSIRHKMTPGQLIDEFTGTFAGGDFSSMLDNLRTQVRDNPLPVTMVGAGLAWLMFGKGPSADDLSDLLGSGSSAARERGSRNAESDHDWQASQGADSRPSTTEQTSQLSGVTHSIVSTASGVADAVSGIANDARDTLSGTAAGVRSGAVRMGRPMQDLLQSEPLAVAAVGLVVGTAIGAMLPHTDTEDEVLGGYSQKLRDNAEKVLDQGVEQAKEVAAEAYGAIKEEAARQSSDGSSGTVMSKLGKVVRSTADNTEEAVRERLSEADKP
ncbi:MAG: DUF3618 domain-containing protein [Mesorhizobium sp.]|uniref:DUF3618 domain-containing protein n=1 Tax=unclassified Mesorhizobium TaxID=325217 RepID=UPI000FCC4F0F|nr:MULTISPECIES: DUF3618 domain-containing protein [unclassified Mesorhizobium]RUX48607.1 DUF3618 domain-containing protein [Mesorhizobium sp. M4A.F.Ca.ET.050.02.1.1]RWD04713.1 MAG: DUF3618 domain-containing protein [Mesorhizobium sp.]RWD35975.1 MAG: DUF3618 domain-containing protein [Mesorhizobium sp.]TIT93072.1 MAG: DUF3618 domain-containing protein [Mesorhizobium sp.]TIW29275.1 MAG: DUF3618 domain-containing protein [Mesorhizobium sp.]